MNTSKDYVYRDRNGNPYTEGLTRRLEEAPQADFYIIYDFTKLFIYNYNEFPSEIKYVFNSQSEFINADFFTSLMDFCFRVALPIIQDDDGEFLISDLSDNDLDGYYMVCDNKDNI